MIYFSIFQPSELFLKASIRSIGPHFRSTERQTPPRAPFVKLFFNVNSRAQSNALGGHPAALAISCSTSRILIAS